MTFFKVVLACLLAVGIMNFASTIIELSLRSQVYVCGEQDNPPDVKQHCKKLTRGQWWAK